MPTKNTKTPEKSKRSAAKQEPPVKTLFECCSATVDLVFSDVAVTVNIGGGSFDLKAGEKLTVASQDKKQLLAMRGANGKNAKDVAMAETKPIWFIFMQKSSE